VASVRKRRHAATFMPLTVGDIAGVTQVQTGLHAGP